MSDGLTDSNRSTAEVHAEELERLRRQLDASQAALARTSEEWWDQNSVQCGNCSIQLVTRGGSIKNNNGLSDDGGGEDEHLCGRCAGAQMYAYQDQIEEHKAALARALDGLRVQPCQCPKLLRCPHCKGSVVEGHDQYAGSWICGACCKEVDLQRDTSRQCTRCAILSSPGAEANAKWLEEQKQIAWLEGRAYGYDAAKGAPDA